MKGAFATIPDQAIVRLVMGIEPELFRPDAEIQKLVRRVVELGADDVLMTVSVDAALVCRAYGLPAVTRSGTASAKIRRGRRLRVNGDTGTLTILD